MEHTLQVLLAVATIYGLAQSEAESPPRWLWLAIGTAPLVRYESLVLSVPALLLLARRGHARPALLTALGMGTALAAFSFFLWTNSGGQWLPSSVEAKALIPRARLSRVAAVWVGVQHNLGTGHGKVLGVAAVMLGAFALRTRQGVGLVAAIAVLGHLVGGLVDAYGRYVAYCYAVLFSAALVVCRRPLALALQQGGRSLALAALVLVAGLPVLRVTYRVPLAMNDIYRQQYQLHRLVTRMDAPVAVNDLGWVSFRNDEYVLDLYGLGNRASLINRSTSTDPSWLDVAVADKGVKLIMIYDDWFQRPASWTPVGRLHLGRSPVSAASPEVAFYTRGAPDQALRELLRTFAGSLPEGTHLTQ
jgi:hypothetical protein